MKKFAFIVSVFFLFLFVACEREQIEDKDAPKTELSGTWRILSITLLACEMSATVQ